MTIHSLVRASYVRKSCKILLIVLTATQYLGFSCLSRAASYDFLTVTGNGIPGNAAFSQFNSSNGNGFIDVRHSFSPGGAGGDDNDNPLIFPSQFTTLFPGTGQVQGHLAQTVYNHTSTITFDLSNYAVSNTTVFGIWNITDEVAPPPGGSAVYRVEILDAGNNPLSLTGLNLIGNQDNQTQVSGEHELVMDLSTGNLSFGTPLGGSTHTDAAFWDNLPSGVQSIVVHGDLPQLNLIGDGVGYYFAELIPEPATAAMVLLSGLCCVTLRRGRVSR